MGNILIAITKIGVAGYDRKQGCATEHK